MRDTHTYKQTLWKFRIYVEPESNPITPTNRNRARNDLDSESNRTARREDELK